jgi:DNA-directed RNA polymerase subunit omega
MARVTIEDCLKSINNRFVLVQMSIKRTRQLLKGAKTLVKSDNREIVNSLREIAQGKVVLDENIEKSFKKGSLIDPD